MLHGRLLAGLAVRAVEQTHGDPSLRLARLTVDLSKAAPMEPVHLSTERIRDGRRVRTVDVRVVCGGAEVAHAVALLLRSGLEPEGAVWTAPRWDVPPPTEVGTAPGRDESLAAGNPDLRFIGAATIDSPGQKRAWLRDTRALVDGEPLSPAVRAAIAADVANPITNFGDTGLHFINADLTLAMARPPAGEWIGLEVVDRVSADGISVGDCALYDETGRFGHTVVCAVATPPFAMPAR